jgi:hypothetical protein
MTKHYVNKNKYLPGFKDCQKFKSTAYGSSWNGDICVITCVYRRQAIERVKCEGKKIKIGGVYSGWSIKFQWIKTKIYS